MPTAPSIVGQDVERRRRVVDEDGVLVRVEGRGRIAGDSNIDRGLVGQVARINGNGVELVDALLEGDVTRRVVVRWCPEHWMAPRITPLV